MGRRLQDRNKKRARMKTPKSPQAKVLRGIIFRKTMLYLALYTVGFAVLLLWANAFVIPDIANYIADATSHWTYYTPEEYDAMLESTSADDLTNLDVYHGTASDGSIQYAVRDLSTYFIIKSFKIPCILCLYFIGVGFIAFTSLNKSLEYFDILSSSVAQMITNKEASVALPDDLSIVRGELNEIKAHAREAEEHAKREEQRKNELVAYLAHDIKTPLTSILGYVSLLKEVPDLPEKQRTHYAAIVFEKAEHLEDLIDEFFEITRYNLQSIPIERETMDIAVFCNQIADEFYPEAQRNNLTIEVKTPQDTTIFADPNKLARAVSNVMRNALAYADENTTIAFEANPTPKGIVLSIQDTGKEISSSHLESIFEKFFREDSSRSSKQGGAGLGLAIAKEIMLAHGGTINATSEHGTTTFRLFIPQNTRQAPYYKAER